MASNVHVTKSSPEDYRDNPARLTPAGYAHPDREYQPPVEVIDWRVVLARVVAVVAAYAVYSLWKTSYCWSGVRYGACESIAAYEPLAIGAGLLLCSALMAWHHAAKIQIVQAQAHRTNLVLDRYRNPMPADLFRAADPNAVLHYIAARYAVDTQLERDTAEHKRLWSVNTLSGDGQTTISTNVAPMLGDGSDAGSDIGPLARADWMQRLNSEPHAIFAAKTKGGKSTMAKVGLQPRITANESIFVIDPHSNGWLNLPSIGGGLNWSEVEDGMATTTRLYHDRMQEREYHMRHEGSELSQNHFPRLTVVFDEANEARTNIEARHKRNGSPWQPFAEIMSSGSRKVGISLWLICQSALIKNLGGSTVMRRNLTVFALDHATIRELLEDEEPMKSRRDAILESISGARYPAATVLDGQAFLLDRADIDQLEPSSARHCAWPGWDYDRRCGLTTPAPLPMADGAIVYPSGISSTNAKIAWLLQQGYSYRQIARELSVSFETISQIKKAMGI